jgi:hypothetical protein
LTEDVDRRGAGGLERICERLALRTNDALRLAIPTVTLLSVTSMFCLTIWPVVVRKDGVGRVMRTN